MEEHHRHHNYNLSDLHFHGGGEMMLTGNPHYEMMVEHCITAPPSSSTLDMDMGCLGTGRWPRQETLTLLEIRSRLDHKFKEANQKGPLWDEVSRIMSEEHGYQRSGKKCREKFENLYKYYKKTKEGKAGRQDGKHYRFFRQLEALYGGDSPNPSHSPIPSPLPTQPIDKHSSSFSLSNSDDFDTSSSEDNKKGKGWKWKVISDVIEKQMQRLVEKQEAWLQKMLATLERKEQERERREEEWRRQEAIRLEREHQFWANERAWVKARDSALMDALNRLTRPGTLPGPGPVPDVGSSSALGDTSEKRRREHSGSGNVCYFPGGDVFGFCERPAGLQNDAVFASGHGDVGALRFLMGDHDGLWENYAAKLGSKGDN